MKNDYCVETKGTWNGKDCSVKDYEVKECNELKKNMVITRRDSGAKMTIIWDGNFNDHFRDDPLKRTFQSIVNKNQVYSLKEVTWKTDKPEEPKQQKLV